MPITLAFLDREGSASHSKLHQFVNVLEDVGSPDAAAAQALLARNINNYGVCSLVLSLCLDPAQCRQLFTGANGEPHDFAFYVQGVCDAEKAILAGDPDSAYRLRLFNASAQTWQDLEDAGAAPNMTPIFENLGMSDVEAELAVTDAVTTIWWARAMTNYATALAKGQSLEAVGKEAVKDANRGYNEPWMILAAWNLAGKPPLKTEFFSSLLTGAPKAQVAGSAPA